MQTARYNGLISAVLLSSCMAGAITEEPHAFEGWFLHASAAGSFLHLDDEGSPYRFSFGGGHPVFHDRVSVMADLVFSYYEVNNTADEHPRPGLNGGESTSLGADLLLRITCLDTSTIDLYIEGGAGFQSMLSEPPFPADGSDQNFTLFGGPGMLIPMGKRSRLMVSVQWFHISNAWLFDRNSGYDGIQVVFGPEWSL